MLCDYFSNLIDYPLILLVQMKTIYEVAGVFFVLDYFLLGARPLKIQYLYAIRYIEPYGVVRFEKLYQFEISSIS